MRWQSSTSFFLTPVPKILPHLSPPRDVHRGRPPGLPPARPAQPSPAPRSACLRPSGSLRAGRSPAGSASLLHRHLGPGGHPHTPNRRHRRPELGRREGDRLPSPPPHPRPSTAAGPTASGSLAPRRGRGSRPDRLTHPGPGRAAARPRPLPNRRQPGVVPTPALAHPGTAGRKGRAGGAARSPGGRRRPRETPSPPPPSATPAATARAEGSNFSGVGRGRL